MQEIFAILRKCLYGAMRRTEDFSEPAVGGGLTKADLNGLRGGIGGAVNQALVLSATEESLQFLR